jgi:hypothetical protein
MPRLTVPPDDLESAIEAADVPESSILFERRYRFGAEDLPAELERVKFWLRDLLPLLRHSNRTAGTVEPGFYQVGIMRNGRTRSHRNPLDQTSPGIQTRVDTFCYLVESPPRFPPARHSDCAVFLRPLPRSDL